MNARCIELGYWKLGWATGIFIFVSRRVVSCCLAQKWTLLRAYHLSLFFSQGKPCIIIIIIIIIIHSFIYSFSFIHSVSQSIIHSFIHSFIHVLLWPSPQQIIYRFNHSGQLANILSANSGIEVMYGMFPVHFNHLCYIDMSNITYLISVIWYKSI